MKTEAELRQEYDEELAGRNPRLVHIQNPYCRCRECEIDFSDLTTWMAIGIGVVLSAVLIAIRALVKSP